MRPGVKLLILFLVLLTVGVTYQLITISSFVGEVIKLESFIIYATVILGFIIAVVLAIIFSWRPNTVATSDAHGSAGFADPQQQLDLKRPAQNPLPPGGLYLGGCDYAGKGYLALPREVTALHTMVLGPTGSGKSRSIIMPNIAWINGASFVCTDPKGELWELTSGERERLGMTVRRYAPTEPEASECFNWVPLCRNNPRLADNLARAIIESGQTKNTQQFWIDGEAAILSAVFIHTAHQSDPTPATAYRILTDARDGQSLVKALQQSPIEMVREAIAAAARASERSRGDMLTSLIARMRWMIDPSIKRFTSAIPQPPDFTDLQHSQVGVYWVLHEQDIGYLRPLSALFFTLMIYQLSQRRDSSKPLVPVTFFLDEFANCGTIIGFDSIVTLARGRDLAFVIGIQALSQVPAIYGRERGETIINNLRTMLILPGIRGRSAEEISRELGDTTRTGQHYSSSYTPTGLFSGRRSETVSTQEWRRRLLTADEIRRLGEHAGAPDLIAIITNRRPLYLWRYWYDALPSPAQALALGPALVGETGLLLSESKPTLPPPLPKLEIEESAAGRAGAARADS